MHAAKSSVSIFVQKFAKKDVTKIRASSTEKTSNVIAGTIDQVKSGKMPLALYVLRVNTGSIDMVYISLTVAQATLPGNMSNRSGKTTN